jgi:hypothetical protein
LCLEVGTKPSMIIPRLTGWDEQSNEGGGHAILMTA